ncbi:MAG: hypothetical protein ACRDKW_01525, partial [Actinomycetota bacterium]
MVVTPGSAPVLVASETFGAELDIAAFIGVRLLDDPALPHPRFCDDVWDLSAIADVPVADRMPCRLRIDWTQIANPTWRICAKEVGLALLQPEVGLARRIPGARRRAVHPHALRRVVLIWRSWFAWMADHGLERLADLTQPHCDAWLAGRQQEVTTSTVLAEVSALRLFADYRTVLTLDVFAEGFRPWGSRTASHVAGWKSGGENATPVIPDDVLGPVLAGALFLVETAGPDVLAARAQWRAIHERATRPSPLTIDERLSGYLAELRRAGRCLPALDSQHLSQLRGRGALNEADPLHRVNLSVGAGSIGVDSHSLVMPNRRPVLEAALEELGCAPGGISVPVTMVENPTRPGHRQPWHGEFSPWEVEDLGKLVLTACYIVVAALSGLRHGELAEMRRGCVRAELLPNGKMRYRIHGKVTKGRPFGGEAERWTVIEQVAIAFRLAGHLVDEDLPFARLCFGARYPRFVRWVNGPGARAFLAPIPVDWRVNGRQFRRTLARLLGFRPHGVLAGKIHLK